MRLPLALVPVPAVQQNLAYLRLVPLLQSFKSPRDLPALVSIHAVRYIQQNLADPAFLLSEDASDSPSSPSRAYLARVH